MEGVLLMHHTSQNQTMSPYKSHIRNVPQRMMISKHNENLYPSNMIHTGLLQTPPHLFPSHSFPPYLFPQQPLSPLVIRALSCPPINKKPNNYRKVKPRDSSSLTTKKTKGGPKKEEIKSKKVIKPSTGSAGPDTKNVPKDAPKVLSLSTSTTSEESLSDSVNKISVRSVKVIEEEGDDDKMNMFSGCVVYTVSPPPSSLPLPTFSLRPKLSCTAQASASIDAGATDNLRRLLRLV